MIDIQKPITTDRGMTRYQLHYSRLKHEDLT